MSEKDLERFRELRDEFTGSRNDYQERIIELLEEVSGRELVNGTTLDGYWRKDTYREVADVLEEVLEE